MLASQDTAASPGGVLNGRLQFAIDRLVEGYTTGVIVEKMKTALFRPFTEIELVQLRQQYAPEIADLRESLEIAVLESGLSRRSERIRRLSVLTESLEKDLKLEDEGLPVPLKVSKEYRETIGQIAQEVDPLGLHSALDPKDPWFILITNMMQLRSDQHLTSSSSLPTPSDAASQTISVRPLDPEHVSNLLQAESEPESQTTPPSS